MGVVGDPQAVPDLRIRHPAVEVKVPDLVQEAILLGQVDRREVVQGVHRVVALNIRIANPALVPDLLPFHDVVALQVF